MNNNKLRVEYITDPSHGWIKVEKHIFNFYKINKKEISTYSYQDRNFYYLEEDCDATYFIKELKKRNVDISIYPIMVEKTHIRSLNRIN